MIKVARYPYQFYPLVKVYGDREVVRADKIIILCNLDCPDVELIANTLVIDGSKDIVLKSIKVKRKVNL
jgi:hypothetical protein